jgi:NADP-dependent 3-hydroxy acid dehydrogenase YdfG
MSVVIIVGMGPGISSAVARRFGREGFNVIAMARRADALKEQVASLDATGISAHAYVADAADPASLAAAIGKATADHGPPSVLVYNAAGVRYKPLAQLSADELNADLRVSIGGALAAAQAVLPGMRAAGAGTLLFTGGGFAFEPMAAMATVGVGKAGIRNLAFSLFADLKDSGIHAATVTIAGMVKPGTPFDPDKIAETYWTLHKQPKGGFEREIVFKGA